MTEKANIKGLLQFITLLTWIIIVIIGLHEHQLIELNLNSITAHVPIKVIKGLSINILIVCLYFFFHIKVKAEDHDIHLFWGVFNTAIYTLIVSVTINIFLSIVKEKMGLPYPILYMLLNYADLLVFIYFLMHAAMVWKKLILFKYKNYTIYIWYTFEILLWTSLLLHFFRLGVVDLYFNIGVGLIFSLVIPLAFSIQWISLFNFTEKIKVTFLLGFFQLTLLYFVTNFRQYIHDDTVIISEFLFNIYPLGLFFFVFVYSFSSLVHMFFHMPNTSLYEQRENEIDSFKKLSKVVTHGKSQYDIYKVLWNVSLKSSEAHAAWFSLVENDELVYSIKVDDDDIDDTNNLLKGENYGFFTPMRFSYHPLFHRKGRYLSYKSIMVVPLWVEKKHIGTLFLLKKEHNAFDNIALSTISTYVTQASVSLYNLNLMESAVENEVYKSKMAIARKAQEILNPSRMAFFKENSIEGFAVSDPAIEVSGDYYDFVEVGKEVYAAIVADVSGKGQGAAFNMAQMKGMFQSLVRIFKGPKELAVHTNEALAQSLGPGTFITSFYCKIDTNNYTLKYARAGHCPTLHFKAETNEIDDLDGEGLGLGIIRDASFNSFIEEVEVKISPGDILLLYTDGIIESRHATNGEEYGYERLKSFLAKNYTLPLKQLGQDLLADLNEYMGESDFQDDCTFLLLRIL